MIELQLSVFIRRHFAKWMDARVTMNNGMPMIRQAYIYYNAK